MSELAPFVATRPFQERQPLSFRDLSADMRSQEVRSVMSQLTVEQAWFQIDDPLMLATKADVLRAVKRGELVAVPFDDADFTPTRGFINRQTRAQLEALSDDEGTSEFSIPFLRPAALRVLKKICAEAREDVQTMMRPPKGVKDFRYAITSMTRSQNYQSGLVAHGKLALDATDGSIPSTHLFGLAFDIDHSGLYIRQSGEWVGVGIGRREELYFPEAIDSLADRLEKYQKTGITNSICEVPNGLGCYHVAVNPDASFV